MLMSQKLVVSGGIAYTPKHQVP